MPVPRIRKGKWMFIRCQDGALQRKMILKCFFCNLDLTGGTWKNTTSYNLFVYKWYRCFGFGWWNSNMNRQNNDQKTSGVHVHILLPMWKLIVLEIKVGFFGRTARELLRYRIKKGNKYYRIMESKRFSFRGSYVLKEMINQVIQLHSMHDWEGCQNLLTVGK